MAELIVEIGMKLENNFEFYDELLKKHGLKQVFTCTTHDVYYSKIKNFDGFTENQIKNNCIRIRNPQANDKKETKLISEGYYKVFDTKKQDFHYTTKTMASRVQLQIIENIGLVVYYDNPNYYKFSLDEQREMLIKELNSYGFNFNNSDLGIDKLRTLYYGKELFSKNQNG